MNSIIGALRINLGIDSAQFQTALKGAQKDMNAFAARARASFAGVGESIRLFGTIATAVMGGSFLYAIKRGIEAADKIAKSAQRVGMGAEAYQELSYAAGAAGVKQEEFDKSLEQMNKRLGEVNIKGTAAEKALAKIGLSLADVRGQAPEKVFALLMDRIGRIADPMQRAAIATQLFGNSGQKLVALAKEGSAGLKAMAEEARRLGFVISKDTLDKTEKASDEFDRISKSMRAAGINISAGFLPALESLRQVMTSQGFQDGVKTVANEFGKFIKLLVDNRAEILAVIAAFVTFSKVTAASKSPLAGLLVGVAAGLATLEALQDELKKTEDARDRLITRRDKLKAGAKLELIEFPDDLMKKQRDAQKKLEEAFLGLQTVAERGEAEVTKIFQDRADKRAAELESIKQEIEKIRQLNEARKTAAAQPLSPDRQAEIARLNKEIDEHTERVKQLRLAQTEPAARITVNKSPITSPEELAAMDAAGKIIEGLRFKTQLARGEFRAFSDGFAEAAHSAGLFGTAARPAVTAVAELPEYLKRVNAEMQKLKNAEQLQAIAKGIGDAFGRAFEDAVLEAKSLREVIQGLYKDLLRLMMRKLLTEPLGNFLTGALPGMIPGRAMGGPVTAGAMYQVNERGRELFVPRTDGEIIPHNQLRGRNRGGGFTYAPVIDARGADQAAVVRIERVLQQHSKQIEGQGKAMASAGHEQRFGVQL